MKHYWLRCHNEGRKWIHTFHANSDYEAIDIAATKIQKLAHQNQAGLSDFERRQVDDWYNGIVELINEVGVVIREMAVRDDR